MNRSVNSAECCAEPECPIAELPIAALMVLFGTLVPTDLQCGVLCPARSAGSTGGQTCHFIAPDNYSTLLIDISRSLTAPQRI
jgi:hypothetical protein